MRGGRGREQDAHVSGRAQYPGFRETEIGILRVVKRETLKAPGVAQRRRWEDKQYIELLEALEVRFQAVRTARAQESSTQRTIASRYRTKQAEADEGVLVSDFNDARGTPKKAPPRVSPPPLKEPAAQRVVH